MDSGAIDWTIVSRWPGVGRVDFGDDAAYARLSILKALE